MLKKIAISFIVWLFLLIIVRSVFGLEPVSLDFFWGTGCPHCAKEKIFLQSLQQKYPQLEIRDYEIYNHRENLDRLQAVGRELSADVAGVPFTVIGQKYFSGYHSDKTTGKEIEAEVARRLQVTGLVINPSLKNLSLPVLTFTLAILDGFNPCAMWALMFLISLLLGMKDRRRMWIFGLTFIATSSLVYFFFLAAWLNLFLFFGIVVWVRLAIGLVALGAGGYYLRDYWVNRLGVCQISGNSRRQQFFARLKIITQNQRFLLALAGIIVLAVAVNLVELICSAGLPAVYTKILSLSNLPVWQYYLYLAFYILIFMLDDLLVFFTAMITLRVTGIGGKYSRFPHLIGGVLMLAIGLLLLFKPEWLMFG